MLSTTFTYDAWTHHSEAILQSNWIQFIPFPFPFMTFSRLLEWQETCDKTLVAFLLFLATQSHMSATTSNCNDLDLDAHAFVEWVEWKRDTTYFLYYCHTHRAALFLSHTGLLNSSLTLCHKRFVMTYLIWIRKYLSFHLSQSYVNYSSRNA